MTLCLNNIRNLACNSDRKKRSKAPTRVVNFLRMRVTNDFNSLCMKRLKAVLELPTSVQWRGGRGCAHQQNLFPPPGSPQWSDCQHRRWYQKLCRSAQCDGAEKATGRLGHMVVHVPQNLGIQRLGGGVRCQRGSFQFLKFSLWDASTHAVTALNACPLEPGRAPASPRSAHAKGILWDSGSWGGCAGFGEKD